MYHVGVLLPRVHTIQLPKWVIQLPKWVIQLPEWVIQLPEWVIQLPEWAIQLPEWTIQLPEWVFANWVLRGQPPTDVRCCRHWARGTGCCGTPALCPYVLLSRLLHATLQLGVRWNLVNGRSAVPSLSCLGHACPRLAGGRWRPQGQKEWVYT